MTAEATGGPPPDAPVDEHRVDGTRADEAASAARGMLDLAHDVWDRQALGRISTGYAHNAVVHRADGDEYGRDAVLEHAVQTLAAFPDLRLHGDEALWDREPDGAVLVSLRTAWSGHHRGHGRYGPPTGRRVQRREIAQRLVVRGRVVEEWIVHDEIAVLRQLGLDEVEFARDEAARGRPSGLGGPDTFGAPPGFPFGEVVRRRGQLAPSLADEDGPARPEAPLALFERVWNARMLNEAERLYAPDAVVRVPGGRRLDGPAEVRAHVLGLLAAFPDAAVTVDRALRHGPAGPGDEVRRVAVRWTLQGTHTGPGRLGPPTGRRVRVPGLSHFRLRHGRIEREDTLYDEFALLQHLVRAD